jgi:hypothetical protein
MSVEIKSGVTTDVATIDPTSKALRVTNYSQYGDYQGLKKTYRAATNTPFTPAVTANRVIALFEGSATKKITIKRIVISGVTLTAVQYLTFNVRRYSTAATGGTRTALVQVQLDSNDGEGSLNTCCVLTAVATEGTLMGDIASRRTLAQATTPAAAGVTEQIIYEFGTDRDNHGIVLRGIGQGIGIVMPVAPATTPTLSIEIEWTEE